MNQVQTDCEVRPVAFLSHKLNPQQLLYTVTELEMYAIWYAFKKWRHYLEGQKFHLYTDHIALQYMRSIAAGHGRLARWAHSILEYDFKAVYRKGTEHIVPDGLSRDLIGESDNIPSYTDTDSLLTPNIVCYITAFRTSRQQFEEELPFFEYFHKEYRNVYANWRFQRATDDEIPKELTDAHVHHSDRSRAPSPEERQAPTFYSENEKQLQQPDLTPEGPLKFVSFEMGNNQEFWKNLQDADPDIVDQKYLLDHPDLQTTQQKKEFAMLCVLNDLLYHLRPSGDKDKFSIVVSRKFQTTILFESLDSTTGGHDGAEKIFFSWSTVIGGQECKEV